LADLVWNRAEFEPRDAMPIESRLTGRDELPSLLGPELAPFFDASFVRSWDLHEAYIQRLAGEVFLRSGLATAFAVPRTVEEAIADGALKPSVAAAPVAWLVGMLERGGWLAREGDRYVLVKALPEGDAEAIRAQQAEHDPRCLPSYDLADYAARHYPAVLAGTLTGERALGSPEALESWTAYFSNANPLYAVTNVVGAQAAAQALGRAGGLALELGAGLGSGTEALLGRLPSHVDVTYRVTDASPLFLRRAKRALAPRFPTRALEFSGLDVDRRFADAGIAPDAYALVYGVNVLHVARDLEFTLGEIRRALAPGGALVFSECVRPFAGAPVPEEFAFNLLDTFREPVLVAEWRPNGGFLTPEQWIRALEANGFVDVRVIPDIATISAHYPSFVVAAITARPA
jgi:SAM-dependent methyltransferase